jgi:hypothetical protein
MSDHGSGPRATADPVIDISDFYAFPTPEQPGRFVLVMVVFPFAMPSALFSDAVDYRFRLRPARANTNGAGPSFAIGDEERVISVTFGAPQALDGGDTLTQTGTCTLPSGEVVSFRVGDEAGGEANGVRVFAGCRLDPFYIDQAVSGGIRTSRRLPDQLSGKNSLDGQNALGIVVEGDISTLFGARHGPLFALVAETTTVGSLRIRLERLGRPEIKNFIMLDRASDTVNRDLEIRDIYNMEDAFSLLPDYMGAYRSRINGGLVFYDGLDGKTDWPLDAQGNHPLTDLLLADFLVVDVSKPFDENGYLEIERQLPDGTAHETCGGRSLNHDMVDTFLTFLVNNGDGPRISDGVDHATVPASATFPYLQPPNLSPPGKPELVLPSAMASS